MIWNFSQPRTFVSRQKRFCIPKKVSVFQKKICVTQKMVSQKKMYSKISTIFTERCIPKKKHFVHPKKWHPQNLQLLVIDLWVNIYCKIVLDVLQSRGFTRQPESPNVHIRGSRSSPPKFNETTPKRGRKNENCGGRGKKSENLGVRRRESGGAPKSWTHPRKF